VLSWPSFLSTGVLDYLAYPKLVLISADVFITGLEDGDQDTTDPSSIQGAYLSFLHLRHLRIRDLQRMVCNRIFDRHS